MDSLSDNYVLDALEAEREGTDCPVEFDVVWNELGYNRFQDAQRFMFASVTKTLTQKGQCRLAPCNNQKSKYDKIFLSVKGFKFSLARANTERGAEYLLHLLDIEQQYFLQLLRSLNPQINPQLDPTRFDFCFDAAIQVTGHRNRYDTQKRLLTYLNEKTDYYWDRGRLMLVNPIYYSFIAASRAVKGIDVEKIGETVTLDWNYYCRVCKALKSPKNALFAIKRFKPIFNHKQLETGF